MYIAIILIVIVLLVVVSKNSKADQKLKEVAKYDDQTLTPDEKNIADMLFQVIKEGKANEYEQSEPSFHAAIDELAMEIFKLAMWRLNNKKLANHYFQNQGYINVLKLKIITNFFKIYNDSSYSYAIFNDKSGIQQFVLQWVLKIRDDTTKLNHFLG